MSISYNGRKLPNDRIIKFGADIFIADIKILLEISWILKKKIKF